MAIVSGESPVSRTPVSDSVRANRLSAPVQLPSYRKIAAYLILGAVIIWAWTGTGITFKALVDGWPYARSFVGRMFPPHWAVWRSAVRPMIQTIQMGIIGTLIGVVIAFPIALFAAKNLAPHPVVYYAARAVLNVGRTIPDLVLALAFVAMVGLGSFPGTLALGVHSAFSLSKLFAESIETINPRQVEAVESVGANRLQVISFAVIPQALPLMLSYSLLYWESNIRAATVLGLVGAGGIGFQIQVSMRLFRYHDLTVYILMLIVTVTIIDRASAMLRARIT